MAIPTTNPGYIDADNYEDNPVANTTPDSVHHEHDIGVKARALVRLSEIQADLAGTVFPRLPTVKQKAALDANATLDGDHPVASQQDAQGYAAAARSGAVSDVNATKGQANGIAPLGSDSKISATYLPAIAITDFLGLVGSEVAMLALRGEKGDWCNRSDINRTFIIVANDGSLLSDWVAVLPPMAPVLSVAGKTGDVTLTASDVGAASSSDFSNHINATGTSVHGLGSASTKTAGTGTGHVPIIEWDFAPVAYDYAGIVTVIASGADKGKISKYSTGTTPLAVVALRYSGGVSSTTALVFGTGAEDFAPGNHTHAGMVTSVSAYGNGSVALSTTSAEVEITLPSACVSQGKCWYVNFNAALKNDGNPYCWSASGVFSSSSGTNIVQASGGLVYLSDGAGNDAHTEHTSINDARTSESYNSLTFATRNGAALRVSVKKKTGTNDVLVFRVDDSQGGTFSSLWITAHGIIM